MFCQLLVLSITIAIQVSGFKICVIHTVMYSDGYLLIGIKYSSLRIQNCFGSGIMHINAMC